MSYRIVLRSSLPRVTVPTAQRVYTHSRTLIAAGSRPATDPAGTPSPKTRMGLDRDTLYIAGGLAAIGAIWYFYAMVEHARIEKKREGLEPRSATASVANAEGSRGRPIEDATHSTKSRAEGAFKSAQ
jgi:hypothetical protein